MGRKPERAVSLPTLRFAVLGVLVAGVLTRGAGLLREMVVASRFGTSAALDEALLALSVPMMFAVGIGGGVARAVVPVAAKLARRRQAALLRASSRLVFRRALVLTAFLALGSFAWVWALLHGTEYAWSRVQVASAFACFAIAGGALTGLLVGFANAQGRHVGASFNPVLYNVVIIGAVLGLTPSLGAMSVLAGVVLAEWCQLLAVLPSVLGLLRERPAPVPQRALAELQRVFWPAALLGFAAGMNTTIDRAFASTLGDGAISALSYADKLLNLPIGLVGMALTAPFYTRLARLEAEGNRRAFEATLLLGVLAALGASAPAALALAAFAEPTIGALLGWGKFALEDTLQAGTALRGYALAMVFQSLHPLFMAAAFAKGRPWAAVGAALAGCGLNALFNALLIGPLGLTGVALATSLATGAVALLLALPSARVLLRSRLLWRCVGTLLPLLAVTAAGMVAARWIVGDEWQGSRAVMVMLALAGTAFPALLAVALLRPALLRRWHELKSLRRQVAAAVAAKGDAEP